MMQKAMRGLRGLARNRRGVVSLEAALIFCVVLTPLLLGAMSYGEAFMAWTRMNRVEQSLLFYVWQNPANATNTTVSNFVTNNYSTMTPAMSASASTACYCITPTGSRLTGTSVSCSGTCTSGQQVAEYVSITVSTSLTLPATVPGLANPLSLSSTGTVRIQ